MKTVSISTQPSCHSSEKIHRLFHSINLTLLVCGWLAGWLPDAKPAGHGGPRLSCNENDKFY